MRAPRIRGVIRRRLLVNFRVDPDVMSRHLPEPFRPKLHRGYAIAGICLIRLEGIHLTVIPLPIGASSENAAHRVAVYRGDAEAVFVPRRDSNSWLNHWVGSRMFPGRYHRAHFDVSDDTRRVDLRMSSSDGTVSVRVSGKAASELPEDSVFSSVNEASRFFETGSLGYSPTVTTDRFDAIELKTREWSVAPLEVHEVSSSYFEDETLFPLGSAQFDHALVMRNLDHEWCAAPDLFVERPAT